MEGNENLLAYNVAPVKATGDAVGVSSGEENNEENLRWYVAIVNNRAEKKCAELLTAMGIENYVATQKEVHVWSRGRKRVIDRIVMPSLVFVRTTEHHRLKTVAPLPYVNRFYVNRAGEKNEFGRYPVAIISQKEIDTLRFMLGESVNPVTIEERHLKVGDPIRVVRGALKTLQGRIREIDGDTYLYVSLDILGSAKVKIDPQDIEKL